MLFALRSLCMRPNAIAFVVAALTGLLVSGLLTWHSGSPDVTASPWYLRAGYPAICAVAAIFGYLAPKHAWRWGLTPLLVQAGWEILFPGSIVGTGNLGPFAAVVTIAIACLYALPPMIAATIAAAFARRAARAR